MYDCVIKSVSGRRSFPLPRPPLSCAAASPLFAQQKLGHELVSSLVTFYFLTLASLAVASSNQDSLAPLTDR